MMDTGYDKVTAPERPSGESGVESKNTGKMRFLFFGAGVLGSLYAARLKEAGADVTLVARGSRLADLREHGIVLERHNTGERTSTAVRLLEEMPADEYFDVCVVLVRKDQLDSALPALAANTRIPAFLFMVNTAEGPQSMIDALGRGRVMMGHANAGGERDGFTVIYRQFSRMAMGELDGKRSERIRRIAGAFRAAGFPVSFVRNIDAWKRYHVAMGVPWAYGYYMAGDSMHRLSHSREDVGMCVRGVREGFRVLRANGFPLRSPRHLQLLVIPDFILVPAVQRILRTELMDVVGARHARAARGEMEQLGREILALADNVGMQAPVLRELLRYSEHSVPPAVTA